MPDVTRSQQPTLLDDVRQVLRLHHAGVQTRHQQDLAQGHGEVYLPQALARKHPHAAKAWGWP
jgi:hypothetical protein